MGKILCFVILVISTAVSSMSASLADQMTPTTTSTYLPGCTSDTGYSSTTGNSCSTPSLPQVAPPDFMGQWTLGFANVGEVMQSGSQQSIPYMQMNVTLYSMTSQDGVMFYTGAVDGYAGTTVSVIYQMQKSPDYVDVYVLIPVSLFPGSLVRDYLQMDIRMFILPGASYLTGVMDGSWNTQAPGGQITPDTLYHSGSSMIRPGVAKG